MTTSTPQPFKGWIAWHPEHGYSGPEPHVKITFSHPVECADYCALSHLGTKYIDSKNRVDLIQDHGWRVIEVEIGPVKQPTEGAK